MTSNQIALQSVLENERHNKATEGLQEQANIEINRHNVSVEGLQADANAIAAEKNRITETFNTRDLDLKEQYNRWYTEFTSANESRKRDIEQEGVRIQKAIAENQDYYQRRMVEIGFQEADIKAKAQQEDRTHNVNMEVLQARKINQDKWMFDKEMEYKDRALETENALKSYANEISAIRVWNDFDIQNRKLGIEENRLGVDLFNVFVKSRQQDLAEKQFNFFQNEQWPWAKGNDMAKWFWTGVSNATNIFHFVK